MYYESVFIFSGQLTEKAANDKFIELKSVIEKSGAKILKNEYDTKRSKIKINLIKLRCRSNQAAVLLIA